MAQVEAYLETAKGAVGLPAGVQPEGQLVCLMVEEGLAEKGAVEEVALEEGKAWAEEVEEGKVAASDEVAETAAGEEECTEPA